MKLKRITSALLALLMAASTFAVGTTAAEAKSAETEKAEDAAIDCRYIGFDTTLNMYKYDAAIHSGSGNYKIITEGEDAPYLKLYYSNEPSVYSPYRFSLKFTSAGKVNTDFKFMRITYRTTDTMAASINLVNTATEGKVALVENTKASGGEWVRSEAVNITTHSILSRFASGGAIPIEYTGSWKDADIGIKEVVFFKTVEDAYNYYGEQAPLTQSTTSLTFGELGNGKLYTGPNYGEYTVNDEDGTIDVVYAEETNYKNMKIHYMAKVKGVQAFLPDNAQYMRLEYAAKNPEGVTGVVLDIASDGNRAGSLINLVADVKDTNGKFVLSPTVEMNDLVRERLLKNGHCSITTNVTVPGGEYRIKALHFFPTKEEADAYTNETAAPDRTISLFGNDISKYSIVISDEAPAITATAARTLAKRIEELTGIVVPVVSDTAAKSEYEIIIGQTNRKSSYEPLYKLADDYKDYKTFAAYDDGNSLVITAVNGYAIRDAVDIFMRSFLYVGLEDVPKNIEIDKFENFVGKASGYSEYKIAKPFDNIENPTVFTEDFDTDEGYFTEESGEDGWKYKDGAYVSDESAAQSFVHVWEPDVAAEATFKFASATADGDFGLMLRYTDKGAYAKAGYDFVRGEWYIDYREGLDHYRVRAASKADTVKANTEYTLNFTADDENVTLTVNGKEAVKAQIRHVTPGQPGVYSNNISVTVDNYSASLLSAESTVMQNVTHIKLPDDIYREGGSVIEMKDGRWIYQHHSGAAFESRDNGATWQKVDTYFPIYGYQQVLRLADGSLMQIGTVTVNGEKHIVSFTSADDGNTWTQGGSVIAYKHPTYGINGGNMNDKLTQMPSTGRIFYSVCYEGDATVNGSKRKVFCEFHYSDDNGKTWKQSETATYDMEGIEKVERFGECKILECADGTLRMYNSWSTLGCVVYSESKDGGVTWGPIEYLEGFTSSHASMQFARDPYGPTPTTYYMVWIYAETPEKDTAPNRSRLSLAYTEDGKNWEYLGDIWRWESPYRDQLEGPGINHIVDPFIVVAKDHVICGTGISEKYDSTSHNAQRQNIWTIEKATLPEGKPLTNFEDVKLGAPYYSAVMYAVENGLFNGTSETTFEPDTTMNRAMFVTVLGRLDKADVSKYTAPTFSDVAKGQWYTSYVEWAADNGIVNGIGGGKYGVTGTITVEQACTILYRYNGGKDGKLDGAAMTDFADASSVSDWANDGVKWAVENGIYEGVGGKLAPTSAADRATVATMFANYVKAFG